MQIRDIVFEQHYRKQVDAFMRQQMSMAYQDGTKHGVQVILSVVHSLINDGKEVTPETIKDFMETAAKIAEKMGMENPSPKDIEKIVDEMPYQPTEKVEHLRTDNVVKMFPLKNS